MFFRSLFVSALATVAVAQEASRVLYFTRVPNPVTAGSAQALIYSTNDTSSPVTIILRKGPATNLQTIETLTTDAINGELIWTPSNILENDSDYALQIQQGSQVNYFGPFTLQGSSEEESSSSSSASSSATSSASHSSMTAPATYPAGNATHTATGTGSLGTGTAISRNTTMVSPTRSTTASRSPTATTTNGDLQATSSPPPSNGAASSLMAGGSAIALVIGAVGAIVMG